MAKKKINGVETIDLDKASLPELLSHQYSFLNRSIIKKKLAEFESSSFDINEMLTHLEEISKAINLRFF